ncbi:MAG: LysR family transcriptional regulator [Bradyrhizobium sp.]
MSLNLIHLSRTDLNLLVLFQAVFDARHVGHAAEQLNLTPSAVSHGLGRLRKLLNDPLFLRTPKGVVPTSRALALVEQIEEILARVHGVMSSAVPFNAITAERRFIIGGPDAVLASTTGLLARRVATEAPHVDLGVVHLMPERRTASGAMPPWSEALAMLERREIDLALLPIRRVPPRFEARYLYDEDFVVATRKGHRFARAPGLAAFCAAEHLLVSLSGDPHGFIDEMLARRGLTRRIALTVPSFTMALTQLADSDLLAVLPRSLVRQYATPLGLAAVELPFERKPDAIHAIVTKAALMDAGVNWLRDLLCGLPLRSRR